MNSNNKYHKEILLIYTTCPPEGLDLQLPLWKTKVPAIGIKCNSTTKFFDCNEAGLYLDFIIKHYDRPLAKTYIFAHGHELAWHYPISLLTAINKAIQTRYFKKQNFGGIFDTMYSQGPYSPIEIDWAPRLYKFVFNGTSMPSKIIENHNQRPCCSTFFVKSDQIRNRKKEEYIHIRKKLTYWSQLHSAERPNPAYYCGRIMEYSWHILFTNQSYIPVCWQCCNSLFVF